jgi:D-arabinose 1-dehydrogenase-like Zn-dependent alcohol dehydrogenase
VLHLEPGESVVVIGAGGGVGLHAVALASLLGLNVLAITTSAAKVAAVRAHGAHEVVVSRGGRFAADVKGATYGGAEAVLDPVGAPTVVEALHALRPGGRYVLLGNVTARDLPVPAGLLLLKGLRMLSSVGITAAGLTQLLALVADGSVSPEVADVVPLDDAARCHRALEARAVTGRLVLSPGRVT